MKKERNKIITKMKKKNNWNIRKKKKKKNEIESRKKKVKILIILRKLFSKLSIDKALKWNQRHVFLLIAINFSKFASVV